MRSRALAPPTNYPRAVLPLITSLLQRRLLAGAAASGRPKRKARMRPSWLGLGLGLGLGLRGEGWLGLGFGFEAYAAVLGGVEEAEPRGAG